MKIGIIAASDTELAPVLSRMRIAGTNTHDMLTFHEGMLHGRNVVAAYSGVGKVNAAIAALLMAERMNAGAIICTGCAGAIKEGILIFDTIISERIAYHDMAEDILTDYHPWMNDIYFIANKELIDASRRYVSHTDIPARYGTTVSGEAFITNEQRGGIQRRFDPLSVDMEAAAIAHVCHVSGLPFLNIRTITDTAEESGIDAFDRNAEKASEIAAEVVSGTIREL